MKSLLWITAMFFAASRLLAQDAPSVIPNQCFHYSNSWMGMDAAAVFISAQKKKELFDYFNNREGIFNWDKNSKNCENRAHAVCIVLEKWALPSYKVWVIGKKYKHSGQQLTGKLKENWNYHVAAAIPILSKDLLNQCRYQVYIIDPATQKRLVTVDEWLDSIAGNGSYKYFYTAGNVYTFSTVNGEVSALHTRTGKNFSFTMHGIAGYKNRRLTFLHFKKRRVTNQYLFLPALNPKA